MRGGTVKWDEDAVLVYGPDDITQHAGRSMSLKLSNLKQKAFRQNKTDTTNLCLQVTRRFELECLLGDSGCKAAKHLLKACSEPAKCTD